MVKLSKENVEDILSLTPIQEGILFHHLKNPHSDEYFEQLSIEITGEVNEGIFRQAWESVIRTNEMLRTLFRWEKVTAPVQIILKEYPLQLEIYDLQMNDEEQKRAILEKIKVKDRDKKFDLNDVPFRITLCKLEEEKYEMMISNHHILYDGWSNGILLKEFLNAYHRYNQSESYVLPIKKKYKEFVKYMKDLDRGQQKAFWQEYLKGFDLQTRLVSKNVKDSMVRRDRHYKIQFPKEQLEEFARKNEITLAALIYSVWGIALQKANNCEDIVFGTTVSGRSETFNGVEDLVGLFINTIPLRVKRSTDESVIDLIKRVNQTLQKRKEHENTPLVDIKKYSELDDKSNLFDTIVVLENYPLDQSVINKNDGLTFTSYSSFEMTNYDLTIGVTVLDDIEVCFSYNEQLFDSSTIERLAHSFSLIMDGMMHHPEQKVEQIEIITKEEKEQILNDFNHTRVDFSENKTVCQLFEQQVRKTPEQISVVCKEKFVTYKELDEMSNRLANVLIKKGVQKGEVVGIMVERSIEMLAGIIAILKAGCAYLPVDPTYPESRKRHMFQDSHVHLLLTQKHLIDSSISKEFTDQTILFLDDSELFSGNSNRPNVDSDPTDLFSIFYTSGTTGKPKGVMVENRNVVNIIRWFGQNFRVTENTNILQMTDYIFDPSIEDFFGTLVHGGTLHIAEKDVILNKQQFCDYVDQHQIHLINFIPTVLKELLCHDRKLESLRTVISGGEPMEESLKDELIDKGYELYNIYGPTETTIDALCWKCSTSEKVLLGKPVSNVRCYILDQDQNLAPIGFPGELYIAGAGVTRGYLNMPESTDEKFLSDPYMPGERMYKTGDLGRWLPTGEIEMIGRIDHQVKIRGYRIELGEIQQQLLRDEKVKEAVVVDQENKDGKKVLCAYIVSETQVDVKELKEFLAVELPEYMIPSYFVQLDQLPLTPIGKIDRKALPAPDLNHKNSTVAPRNQTEVELVEIWSSVLGIEKETISIYDNFFELGGDSILSIQVAGKAMQVGLQVTVSQMFQYQTIIELARVVDRKQMKQEETNTPETGEVLLTPIQKWFFEQDLENPHHWNQSVLLETEHNMNSEWLKQSFQILARYHDSLRLRYHQRNGEWSQVYSDSDPHVLFDIYDLSDTPIMERHDKMSQILSDLQCRLNITEGPIMRAAFFDYGKEQRGKLFMTAHHLVVDGYSWRIIIEDLQGIYEQLKNKETVQLPPKSLSFKKWSEYLYEYAHSTSLKEELGYWLDKASSSIHSIPVDLKKGLNTEKSARTISVKLRKDETQYLLSDIHSAFKTRIDDILLTALSFTFSSWNGATLIDLEGHGRVPLLKEHDVSRTIGWFTCVYPMVLHGVNPEEPMANLIKQVKEDLRKVPHGGIGYELLYYLADQEIREKITSKPRAQVTFNYLGQFEQILEKSKLFKISDVNTGSARDLNGIRSHLIDIDCMIVDGELNIEWKYSTHKHLPETIQRLADDFVYHLRNTIQYCKAQTICQFTPSDFPLVEVGQKKLDDWVVQYKNIEDIYPLSPVQQSMVFHHIYSPDSSVTVEQTVFTIHSHLNIEAFKKTWQTLLDRHESLRASYHWDGLKEPIQVIHKDIKVPFEVIDWSDIPEDESQQKLDHLLEEDRRKGFDLSSTPLMRVLVVKRKDSLYEVVWTHHHLQFDGWSSGILLKEIGLLYKAYCDGDSLNLNDALSLREYVKWLQKQDLEKAEDFWKQALKGFQTPIRFNHIFPTKVKTQAISAYGDVVYEVSDEIQEKMKSFAKKHRITLNTIVQGAWAILLNRYSGINDVVFGTTSSGRPVDLNQSDSIIGCLMNTQPFRINVDDHYSLKDWLQNLQLKQAEMRQFEYTSLADIRNWSEVPRDTALFDLYESIVIFENYPFELALKEGLGSLNVASMRVEEQMDYPLTVYCNLHPKLHVKILFDHHYLDEAEANQILGHLVHIIQQILACESGTLGQLSMMSEQEIHEILVGRNHTLMYYPKEQCFNDLFEAQVKLHPHHTAVMQDGERLSYRELDVLSNQLAHKLIKMGVGPEVPVGVYVERSLKMIVGILGILKAGGAFLPIDVNYPTERLKMMLEDAEVPVLLTENALKSKVQNDACQTVCLDTEWDLVVREPETHPKSKVRPDHLAYIIYTSGSSGKPKGVMMPHEAVVSHSIDMIHRYQITPEDRILQFSSISFDISLEQILTTLAGGATLVLRDHSIWTPYQFAKKCVELGLTVTNLPTSYWNEVVQEWHNRPEIIPTSKLRLVVVGGEQMPAEKVSLWEELPLEHILLLNAYGPAETAMTSTLYPVSGKGNKSAHLKFIPVGKPLANRRIYILDESMKPLPVGVKGEIFIGGIPLARGYLNHPELTKEKFIEDPFYDGYGQRLYQTGDLGRMLEDGSIEVLGRKDDQTKIRGHRIDIGEVETVLNRCALVKDGVIVVKEGSTRDNYLVAYYVAIDPEGDKTSEIREFLQNKLPEYMVPSFFIQVDQFPLNPNGKIDRKALTHMTIITKPEEELEVPQTEIQKKLVQMWEELLEVDEVGMNQHFFEIGGQSLKAITLISEIHRKFDVELPLAKVFEMPTIKELSVLIEEALKKKTTYMSIDPVAEQEFYEVSAAQRRMYFVHQLGGMSTNYNMPSAVIIEGKVDQERMEKSFKALINRHEILRTSFEQVEGQIFQRVHQNVDFELQRLEMNKNDIDRWMESFIQPFALEHPPLFRAAIVELSPSKFLLMYDMHHIVSDGLSISILIREFFSLYEGRELPELNLQYKDFAAWQNDLIHSGIQKQEEYWLDQFSQEIPLLDLPTDYPRSDEQTFEGDEVRLKLSSRLTSELNRITVEQGVTLYSVLLSAFNVLLHQYTSQEDIVVGSPVAGRRHADLENLVGMFVNTLALRNDPKPETTLKSFIKEVAKNSFEALENQDYPFEMLVEKLNLNRDLSRHPLFDVMFAFENVDLNKAQVDDFDVIPYEHKNRTAKFDLELKVTELDGELDLVMEYRTGLFSNSTIERMTQHLIRILEAMVEDLTIPIGEIDLLTTAERDLLLFDINRTTVPYPTSKTIKELFEEQVERDPDRIAIVSGAKKITYKELNEKSNQLARHLIEKGAKPNTVIGVLAEPSIEMIVGVWGVIKSGATYLPIDPETPEERICFILESSESMALLTQAHLLPTVTDYPGEKIVLENPKWFTGDCSNPKDVGQSHDPIYLIYTSGTTGLPKGVPVKNQSLVNYISWFTRQVAIKSSDRTMLLSSFAFDLGYTGLYSALLNGCELHVAPKDFYTVPENLLKYLTDNKITYIKLTPSLFNLMVHNPMIGKDHNHYALRLVVLGGEEAKYTDIVKFNSLYPEVEIINHYGPSEATIGSIAHKINVAQLDWLHHRTIIGKPIDNVKVFILNSYLKPVPIGVAGEICIAGDGLTEGYLNQNEMNDDLFVEVSFGGYEKIRLYRTGDLGRFNSHGEIEFLGRIDRQLKIRGFRVEPDEIASILVQHQAVLDAIVVGKKDGHNFNDRLCAYLVLQEDIDGLELRQFLLNRLPYYMMPSSFIKVDQIPLTPNGKINYRALSEQVDQSVITVEYETPIDPIEQKIAEIWSEILEVERVGVNDHFFELGGNSLKAMLLTAEVHKQLHVNIPMRRVFQAPTVKGMGEYIKEAAKSIYASLKPLKNCKQCELSSAQKRLYILNQLEGIGTTYNMPRAILLEGEIDLERLKKVFTKLVNRHEAFRTFFEIVDGEPKQRIQEHVEVEVEYTHWEEELKIHPDEEMDDQLRKMIDSFVRPFDLSQAPLLRVGIIRLRPDLHILLTDMHHIISDGHSVHILTREFMNLYEGKEIPELQLQYKDFAVWQNEFLKTEAADQQEKYWLDVLSGELPVLNMPTNYPRPVLQSFEGDHLNFVIGKDLKERLDQLCMETDATLNMTLLAAYTVLLSKYTSQQDLIIGLPILGRTHSDLHNIIGMFANTLAIRSFPEKNKSFLQLLLEVRENLLKAVENQDYQFDLLVDQLNIKRDPSRSPIFSTMFAFQDAQKTQNVMGDIKLTPISYRNPISKFDLLLYAESREDNIHFELEYSSKLFEKETMKRMSQDFISVLEMISLNREVTIDEIEIEGLAIENNEIENVIFNFLD
ncbi:non-ribosomal peptide synthetase [Hazenella coriacea]|uniref:Non-ribosomal peptide synthase protein (TIGR01720 family)/amino acid adenylation domain-containing protein n=1 Tax=Hazenella coriacea TaxID=1179467 RepID=A0A4R3LA64_9BACL|nr:non-ribosomal peptide synthetase [Hazenella coriacea]TCS97011.1 non-ribosomal peptide synthase protein (TIGR01720 family)/amino acid adenylation domain-containing protein [Hazenella coriacea]